MKLKLIPSKEEKNDREEIFGIIIEPSKSFFDMVFKGKEDFFYKLNAKNLYGEIVCEILAKSEEYEMYILRFNEYVFVYSDMKKEADFEYQLRVMKKKVENRKLKAHEIGYIFTDSEQMLLRKISNMKNITELKQSHINDFFKININKGEKKQAV